MTDGVHICMCEAYGYASMYILVYACACIYLPIRDNLLCPKLGIFIGNFYFQVSVGVLIVRVKLALSKALIPWCTLLIQPLPS